MSEPTLPIVEKLRRQSQCIYLATEATVADDISATTTRSAETITALVEALEEAREAIASLPEDGLGMAQIAFGTTGVDVYPIRDELLSNIDVALSKARSA